MPLQRILASSVGEPETATSRLGAEALHLSEGRIMLNRRVDNAAALVVVRGALTIGVSDDDAALTAGQGVLLRAGTIYSLEAEEESVAIVFALREDAQR